VAIYIRDNILGGTLSGRTLWMTDTPLPSTAFARDPDLSVPDIYLPYPNTWVVMVDYSPEANWGHAVRWFFLNDLNLSQNTVLTNKQFPPTI
jgi:hypothetical protein